jgi:hypothetical protein
MKRNPRKKRVDDDDEKGGCKRMDIKKRVMRNRKNDLDKMA